MSARGPFCFTVELAEHDQRLDVIVASRLAECSRSFAATLIRNDFIRVNQSAVKPGHRLGDIGHAIQSFVESNGYSVVRDYCGHGIGRVFHEDPQVLHYGRAGVGESLVPGMVFTIEPMINAGRKETRLLGDGWTVHTRDRSLSALWFNATAATENGCDVLTQLPGDEI